MICRQQAKYFAYELTRINKDDTLGALSRTLMDAQVDLQPHQVDAAAFALRSPLSNGVLLADEVGLGKTIEAGMVIAQFWAENRRHLIIICPASLREQWKVELEDKFGLKTTIIDKGNYYKGVLNLTDRVVVMSYNFAVRIEADLQPVRWDLVVMDEAHKLRNVYKESSIMSNTLKTALNGRKKLLLTATPLQNSLMELYGLSQIIDPGIFGDAKSFRAQYTTGIKENEAKLQERLSTFCKRTLRRDVLEYIRYTKRKASTFPFTPSNEELSLYNEVRDYLQQSEYALPKKSRQLVSLVVYKLLASSSAAIAGTFETILTRLENLYAGIDTTKEDEQLGLMIDDLDEIDEDGDETEEKVDKAKLEEEIKKVKHFIECAGTIKVDRKTEALKKALEVTFSHIENSTESEPPLKKALIFTESRRTQDYLFNYLTENGYRDKIVLFNGGNKAQKKQTLEKFSNDAEIMISTEAGAEGLNIQFCSVVVNYDLPWNPQRVEQRIGRCHRYGQKHDVIVINFVNQSNKADQRVFELLRDKFHLFEGVFGASDEVLGTIEDGVDIERRILRINQTCRTAEEIERAFNELQKQMEDAIAEQLKKTKEKLLSGFAQTVLDRLKGNLARTTMQLTAYQKMFWDLCKYILKNDGFFDDTEFSFTLQNPELGTIGKYYFITCDNKRQDVDNSLILRLSHPISEHVLNIAKNDNIPSEEVVFDVSNNKNEPLLQEAFNKNLSGWCSCQLVTIETLEKEEYLVLSGIDDTLKEVSPELLSRLFKVSVISEKNTTDMSVDQHKVMEVIKKKNIENTKFESNERNSGFVREEIDKIDKYISDKLQPLEREDKENQIELKKLTKEELVSSDPARKLLLQEQIANIEARQRDLKREYWAAQDELEGKRKHLIDELRKRLSMVINTVDLFNFRWKLA